jgi:hypothetical protein
MRILEIAGWIREIRARADKNGMIALNAALQGMQNAETSFDSAARRISQEPVPQPQDTTSLSDNAVALMQSKNGFEANTKTAHVADQMTKATLSLLA